MKEIGRKCYVRYLAENLVECLSAGSMIINFWVAYRVDGESKIF